MQDQRVRIVASETALTNAIQQVTKDQQVQLIGAQRDLEVARKDFETAANQALAVVSLGQGEADVISYLRTAEASALKAVVTPFGGGAGYARYLYLSKIATNIESIISNTDGPLAEPFRELSRPAAEKGGAK